METKLTQRGSGDPIAAILFAIVMTILIFVISALLDRSSCHGQWERSGLKVNWGPIKGCLVQMPDGRWLPTSAVRDVDVTPHKEEKKSE